MGMLVSTAPREQCRPFGQSSAAPIFSFSRKARRYEYDTAGTEYRQKKDMDGGAACRRYVSSERPIRCHACGFAR